VLRVWSTKQQAASDELFKVTALCLTLTLNTNRKS